MTIKYSSVDNPKNRSTRACEGKHSTRNNLQECQRTLLRSFLALLQIVCTEVVTCRDPANTGPTSTSMIAASHSSIVSIIYNTPVRVGEAED